MKVAICELESLSPYSQSKYYETPKLPKERADDYEKRTWRDRMHVNSEGYVFIPPMAFKNCLASAAKYLSISIPGAGKNKFTKHFECGTMVTEGIVLPVKKEDVDGESFLVDAMGKPGGVSGSPKVVKTFPVIPHWKGKVTFYVLDDVITEEYFAQHLNEAGKFIGLGRFRPQNRGFYGRFKVNSITWSEE